MAASASSAAYSVSFATSSLSCSAYSTTARKVAVPPLSLCSSFLSTSTHSSFFNGGESAAMLFDHSNGFVLNGGALVSQMNLFDRVVRVVKSYANAVISSAEDPEKLLEQTVLEMSEDLTKLRQATAQVLASQKQLENKYKAADQTANDWYKRAKLALQKGEEELAREALKRKKDYEDNAKSLKAQYDQQVAVVENLISKTRLLEAKIQEAKSKKDTLKARAQSAKTSKKVNEMLGNVNTSSALSAFEKMEEKVMALEAEADSLNQLTSDDLAGKFAVLEGGSVDDDLDALKRDMLGTGKKSGELPPGRTPAGRTLSSAFEDTEIEKELNELRRKANES